MASSASAASSYTDIARSIARGDVASVYLLHGEEGFYTDRLAAMFAEMVPEEDRDFNLCVFYAPETSMAAVDAACRRFPVMSDRQVVIVKEAQAIPANELNKLHTYVSSPSPTTVLVICCRGDKAKGKDLIDAVKKNGVLFESAKLRDSAVPSVLSGIVKSKGMHIEPKGLAMLTEYVGTDISRLHNEIDKLAVALGPGSTITPESIERNIGISKDYNNFELIEALASRNAFKAYKIIDYFRLDPKNNPWVLTIPAIFSFFCDLTIYHFTRDKSPSALASALGLKSEWQLKRFSVGASNYNAFKTIEIIGAIRECDAHCKGVGSRMDPYDALTELVFRILNASGRLPY